MMKWRGDEPEVVHDSYSSYVAPIPPTEVEEFLGRHSVKFSRDGYATISGCSTLAEAWERVESATTLLQMLISANLTANYETSLIIFTGNVVDDIAGQCNGPQARRLCAQLSFMFAVRLRNRGQLPPLRDTFLKMHAAMMLDAELSAIDRECMNHAAAVSSKMLGTTNGAQAADLAVAALQWSTRVHRHTGESHMMGHVLRSVMGNPFERIG